MHNLIKIIGLAPSERTLEDFMESLNAERQRVITTLSVPYIPKGKKPTKAAIRAQARNNIAAALAEMGMTVEEFLEAQK